MSYFAEGLMKQVLTPDEYRRNVEGYRDPEPEQAAAVEEAPRMLDEAKPEPAAAAPLTGQGAANIQGERDRYAAAGYGEEETSRLLGGPRQKLGA